MRLTKTVGLLSGAGVLALGMSAVTVGVAGASGTGTDTSGHRHHTLSAAHRQSGVVTEVVTDGFTLATKRVVKTVAITSATVYEEPGAPVPPSGVTTGEWVTVQLAATSKPHQLIATTVVVRLDKLTGAVVSVGTGTLVVQDATGVWHTVVVSTATVYTQAGSPVGLTALTAGQVVTVTGTPDPNDPADLTATTIFVPALAATTGVATPPVTTTATPPATPTPPTTTTTAPPATDVSGLLKGQVIAVGTGSFTVATMGDSTLVVAVTTSTTFSDEPGGTAISGVVVGEEVDVTLATATPPTAGSVIVKPGCIHGTVVRVTGLTIVLATRSGTVTDVDVSATTTYTEKGSATTLGNVLPGDDVTATGSADATDPYAFDAATVTIGSGPCRTNHSTASTLGTPARAPGAPGVGSGPTGVTTSDPGDGHPWSAGAGTSPSPSPPTPHGSPTAGSVVATVFGTVQSVSGDDIVVSTRQGSSVTVVATGMTSFHSSSGTAALTSVVAGDAIAAKGTSTTTSGQLTAIEVDIVSAGPAQWSGHAGTPGGPTAVPGSVSSAGGSPSSGVSGPAAGSHGGWSSGGPSDPSNPTDGHGGWSTSGSHGGGSPSAGGSGGGSGGGSPSPGGGSHGGPGH